jgi:hypothetical protein
MATAKFYREQARLLLLWAGIAKEPLLIDELRQRAQEYKRVADGLDAQPLERPPTGRTTAPVMQQQQQIQSEKIDE